MVNSKFWKNKKVLITGHTGFKGGWLSLVLSKLGSKLYGYSLPPENKDCFYEKTKIKNIFIKSIFGDLNDKFKLKKFIQTTKPEIIFHLAAQPLVKQSYENPIFTFETNILGTSYLCDYAKNCQSVKSLIVVTSDKCYYNEDYKLKLFKETDPLGGKDPYSASKACAEIVTHAFQKSFFSKSNLNCATVRAGNVIGGGDSSKFRIFPDIIKAIKSSKKIVLRNPNAIRPWQHVIDPVIGYINLAEKLYKNKKNYIGPWNFGPETKSIKSVLELVKEVNKFKKIKFKSLRKKNNIYESKFLGLDIKKSKKILRWRPRINFTKSIQISLEWYFAKEKRKITEKQIEKYLNLKT
jgi:CDP-glucose 4,6-dehydratase